MKSDPVSSSFPIAAMLIAVQLHVVGDTNTWAVELEAYYANIRGPPEWLDSMEVIEDLKHTAGRGNRLRPLRLDEPPFVHGERQQNQRRGEPPARSIHASFAAYASAQRVNPIEVLLPCHRDDRERWSSSSNLVTRSS
jgi:hypothetical protein